MLIGILFPFLAAGEAWAATNLYAWVRREQRYVTSAQSVLGDSMVLGNYAYAVGIWNPGPSLVKGATVEFTSAYSPQTLAASTWGVGNSYALSNLDTNEYRYKWKMPDIPLKSTQEIGLITSIGSAFIPGFDSSREVTPTLLESTTSTQQVKVRVKPIQPFAALNVGVSLTGSSHVKVEFDEGSDKPRLRDKTHDFMYWWVDNPQTNRAYEFSVGLRLTNLIFPSRVDFVPYMQVMAYESRSDHSWLASEWHEMMPWSDPDRSVSDLMIRAPGTSQSVVGIEVARTVGYLDHSSAELKAIIVVQGLPATHSSSLYTDRNGRNYYLEVDGTTSRAEFTALDSQRSTMLWLAEKTSHYIRAPQTVQEEPGIRYYCEDNTITLSDSDILLAEPFGYFSHTFMYQKQFLLRFNSWADGNQTGEWLDFGRSVTVEVSPFAVPENIPLLFRILGIRYRFYGWNGIADSDSPRVTFAVERPMNVTALWTEDYSQSVPRVALAAIFTGLLALVLVVTRSRLGSTRAKKPPLELKYDTLLERLETLKASGTISESAYMRLRSEYERRRGRP